MIGETGMVDNFDVSLERRYETSKLSTIPVSPIMSLFNQFSTRPVNIFSLPVSERCRAGNAKNDWLRAPNGAKNNFSLHVWEPIYPERFSFPIPF